MARNYYDIRLSMDTLGDGATEQDAERFCEAAAERLEEALNADVRVRIGDGTESYTFIGADGYTFDAPLTEEITEVLGEVFERFEWVA